MPDYKYICIDLKSFYASVECVERGLDPMTTNLVVADPERSEKTICLAVSPSMKALGVKNRCRVFEIPKGIDYIMAPPRMQKYIDYAAEIYGIYLRFCAKEDIHVYSIDEAFLYIEPYRITYGMTAKELAVTIMETIRREIGVRATAGIGTNLYLAKIALDITAKHAPDFIGILDEDTFRQTLWTHQPLTDFWHIGRGTAARLAHMGIHTMQEIAQAEEDLLYHAFGIDAELLIDHARGRESATIRDIKKYQPKTTSLTSGQVLMRNYSFEEGKIVLREMVEQLCLDMTARQAATSSVTFYVGFAGGTRADLLRGTAQIATATNANTVVIPAVLSAYEKLVPQDLPIRRFFVSCNHLVPEEKEAQLSLFGTPMEKEIRRDDKIQKAVLSIKDRYGKNAMLRGADLLEAATARERNRQIGGHKSGT